MSKQKFKGRTLFTKTTVDNILRIYDQQTQITNWYRDANLFAQNLSELTGHSLPKICGVIAALSPLKSWDENKIIARNFLLKTGPAKHTRVMVNKAKDIISGTGEVDQICEVLNGNKITSFFLNILQPETAGAVTIDRHAVAVALGRNATDKELQITTGQYEFFANCYRIAAQKRNVLPLQMQAVTWEIWRELKAAKNFADVPF